MTTYRILQVMKSHLRFDYKLIWKWILPIEAHLFFDIEPKMTKHMEHVCLIDDWTDKKY